MHALARARRTAGSQIRCRARPARWDPDRAVEPIVATILLVAIAVVLGAVLYVLVAGLTPGSSNPTLGSALAVGPAVAITGTASTAPYCGSGHGCFSVQIAYASPTLAIADVRFVLHNSNGSVQVVDAGGGEISVVTTNGTLVASSSAIPAGQPLVVNTWTYGTGFSSATVLTPQMTIWMELGTVLSNPVHQGFTFEAVAVQSYQGTVTYLLP